MAGLNLSAVINLVDRFSGPANRIGAASARMTRAMGRTRDSLRRVQTQARSVQGFRRLESQLGRSSTALRENRERLAELHRQNNAAGGSSRRLAQQIRRQQERVRALAAQHGRLGSRTREMREQLRRAGIDTRRLAAEERRLGQEAERLNRRLRRQAQMLRIIGRAGAGLSRIGQRMAGLGRFAARASLPIGLLGFSMVRTSMKFEKFSAILHTLEGSSEKAKKSMEWVKAFAVSTPFQLEEVMAAFVKLRSYGMDPTNGLMRTLGDTAAGMGKDVMQAVEAIADAVTGENDRLKDLGITALASGDEFNYTYTDKKGIQQQISVNKNDRAAIQKALQDIWDAKFSGAMERQAKTFSGILSNLMDHWTEIQKMIMDSGPFDFLKQKAKGLLDMINKMRADGTLQQWADEMGQKILDFGKELYKVGIQIWEIIKIVASGASTMARLVGGWDNLIAIMAVFSVLPIVSIIMNIALALKALGVAALANPVVLILAAIAGAAWLVYANWDKVKAFMQSDANTWAAVGTTIMNALKTAFIAGWQLMFAAANALMNAFVRQMFRWGFELMNWISEGMRAGYEILGGTLVQMVENIKNTFNNLASSMMTIGQNIMNGLIEGVKSKIATIKTMFTNLGNTIKNSVQGALGIRSPSRVFMVIGQMITAGLSSGITRSAGPAAMAASRMARQVIGSAANEPVWEIQRGQTRKVGEQAPLMAAGGGGGSMGGSSGDVNVTVTPGPGMNEQDLAEKVGSVVWEIKRGQTVRDRSSHYDAE